MTQQSPQLSFVATDSLSHPDQSERVGATVGPGWFDSSWDLRRGLDVRESWSDDERVHGWIQDFLRTPAVADRAASERGRAAMA